MLYFVIHHWLDTQFWRWFQATTCVYVYLTVFFLGNFECLQSQHNMRQCDGARGWLCSAELLKLNHEPLLLHTYLVSVTHNKHKNIIVFFSVCQTMANCALNLLKFNRFENRVFFRTFVRGVWVFTVHERGDFFSEYQKLVFININLNWWHLSVRLKYQHKHTNTRSMWIYQCPTACIIIRLSIIHRDSFFVLLWNLGDSCWGETAWP